jgi:hypothetical protein
MGHEFDCYAHINKLINIMDYIEKLPYDEAIIKDKGFKLLPQRYQNQFRNKHKENKKFILKLFKNMQNRYNWNYPGYRWTYETKLDMCHAFIKYHIKQLQNFSQIEFNEE